ncbi:MAG TPA: hypothetical protein DCL38_08155 [Lachnospiraceae bacterium]|nr:hypothetical protein [Lachnospiraceae bacterium]
MNKKDVLELRRRLKGDKCNINRMAGCYVDGNKNRVVSLNESFLNLETEEYEKFLDIARKTMGGTIGNNILELDFSPDEAGAGGKQQFFNGLRTSGLNNEELLDAFYELVIRGYRFDGNYLILLFHDVYDVMTKTSDNIRLDESEEVYEYILAAVCPVSLSKPGLSYISQENRIGARIRDWVVGAPDIGFLYPAFDNRSADLNRVDYFIKDPKDSHPDFIEDVLGCGARRTKTEKQKAFCSIVRHAFGNDGDRAEDLLMEIEDSLSMRAGEEDGGEYRLDDRLLAEVLSENEISEEPAKHITENVKREFSNEEVAVSELVDDKALRSYSVKKREQDLVKEVESLRTALSEKENGSEPYKDESVPGSDYDIDLRVKGEIEAEIGARMIDDRRYIVIPIEENSNIKVNGKSVIYEI